MRAILVSHCGTPSPPTPVPERCGSAAGIWRTDSLQLKSDTIRGVNLDEELSQLIVFEQAFSAAARILSTIQKMFDALAQAI